MAEIQKLYDRRVDLINTARKYVEDNADENGALTAEQETVYDRMEQDILAVENAIKRQERIDARDTILSQPINQPIIGKLDKTTQDRLGTASDAYNRAFFAYMRARVPDYDVRNALQIGTDTEGGYTVPDEFERQLVMALEDENMFRSHATVIRTSNGDRKIPLVSSHGSANWIEEEGAYTESDDAFGQVTLGAYKIGTTIKISEELLTDSAFNLETYIANEFGRRIGAKEEEAFLSGNGTGKPTGVFAASGGGQTGVTTDSTTALKADELIDLFHSLKSPYRKNAVWLMNDSTVKAVRKLKFGDGQYVWTPGIAGGAPDTILNRPLYTSSYVPEIAAGNKVIALGDFKYYWIADRQGRSFQRLNELYSMNGQVGFRASQRVDGKLILAEAVKLLVMKSA